MKVIIYKRPDGIAFGNICREDGSYSSGIAEMIASGLHEDSVLEAVAEAGKPKDTISWRIGDSTEIPEGKEDGSYDRTYFEAFVDKGDRVEVDMVKAQKVHMRKIRDARNEKLKELDIETMKGINNQIDKQKLRDIPNVFDLSVATTPEQLKQLWPEELK